MSANDPKRTSSESSPAPSVAPNVTLDNRLNVLPPIDPSGGSCGGDRYEVARTSGYGWAVGWPVASKAQATERTRVVGVLEILGSAEAKTRSEVFAETLQQLGWSVGHNLKIETRNVVDGAIGQYDNCPACLAQFGIQLPWAMQNV